MWTPRRLQLGPLNVMDAAPRFVEPLPASSTSRPSPLPTSLNPECLSSRYVSTEMKYVFSVLSHS